MRRILGDIAYRSIIGTRRIPGSFDVIRHMSTSDKGNSPQGRDSMGDSKEHEIKKDGIRTRIRFTGIKHPSDEQYQEKKREYYRPFARIRGISVEQYLKLLDDHSRKFIPTDSAVCMRINPFILKSIIRDNDSFKSIHVTDSTVVGIQVRRNVEKERIGNYGPDVPDELRPIHGYIATHERPLGERIEQCYYLWPYGDVALVFKEEVKKYTSFTVGDSLNNVRAVPLENPNGDCFPLEHSLTEKDSITTIREHDPLNKQLGDWIPYIEAQIHYGASLKDVERAIITGTAAYDDALPRMLDKANIPYQKGCPNEY